MMIVGASGTTTRTGICKNCGGAIREWKPDYYCRVYQTDQPIWLHSDKEEGELVWCRVTKAEPLEE